MSLLHAGWLRAEAARGSGEPWAEDLIDCYNEAMDHYAERHHLRPGARGGEPAVRGVNTTVVRYSLAAGEAVR
jgi:hypothetical protein